MQTAVLSKCDIIRALNDRCRQTFTGCVVTVTSGFDALPNDVKACALQKVRSFAEFDDDNDPHHEHDMAFFEEGGERYFFKLDYFDLNMEYQSPDPADPKVTVRSLTIGLASDY